MEMGPPAILLEGYGRTASFHNLASQCDQQGLDTVPWQIAVDWIGKNGFERFIVLAVHGSYDITPLPLQPFRKIHCPSPVTIYVT